MTRMKSLSMTTLGIIAAIAALGLFATVGLAIIGAMAILGAAVAIMAGIKSLMPKGGEQNATLA